MRQRSRPNRSAFDVSRERSDRDLVGVHRPASRWVRSMNRHFETPHRANARAHRAPGVVITAVIVTVFALFPQLPGPVAPAHDASAIPGLTG